MAAPVVHAERNVVFPQELINGIGVPSGVAKFDDILVSATRQQRQELLQAVKVDMPIGRKLKKNRTHLALQGAHAVKKGGQSRLWIEQSFSMRNKAARFNGKAEIAGSRGTPIFDCSLGGQPIKTIIDFECIEVPRVPLKVFCGGESRRVETVLPVPIMPTGCSDPQPGRYESLASRMFVPRLNL